MLKACMTIIACVAVAFISVSAMVINIPADYLTIQQGINATFDGDTVMVQPGIYVENINFNGHNIILGSLFLTAGDTSYILTTQIDGNHTSTVVVFENGEDSTCVIAGFTIKYGDAENGAGINCSNQSSPVISNNHILSNYAFVHAGGISCTDNSNATIINNRIAHNFAMGTSGGILIEDSNAKILDNTIHSNNTSQSGGGICCMNSFDDNADPNGPRISGNIISENHAGYGGGISCGSSNPLIINNIIIGNDVNHWGAGISCGGTSSPIIRYNTISENESDNKGGGIDISSRSTVIIENNNFIGNTTAAQGGGIYCHDELGTPIIRYNVFRQNNAGYGGGIAVSHRPKSIIINNIFDSNHARWGGGLYCRDADPLVENNVFYNNAVDSIGGGICYDYESFPTIINTILWSNSAMFGNQIYPESSSSIEVSYCNIEGGWVGIGNINELPYFYNPDSGNFHIVSQFCGDLFNSPCVDAGSPVISDSLLDCDWGLNTKLSDIGAYGGRLYIPPEDYLSSYLPGDVNMSVGTWPPAATGPDVTYLVNYFRSSPTSQSCLLDGFWASADANGDCNVIGSDVTKLVNVFRGIGVIEFCSDYPPMWMPGDDLPEDLPEGWPNCE